MIESTCVELVASDLVFACSLELLSPLTWPAPLSFFTPRVVDSEDPTVLRVLARSPSDVLGLQMKPRLSCQLLTEINTISVGYMYFVR